MTLKDIQMKLYEKLKPSGWGNKLRMFLLSDEFYKILLQLHENTENNKRFTPVLKDVFNAFEKCHYEDLKIVMVASKPHNVANKADGMAFSSNYISAPLRAIFQELENTVYPDGYRWDPDLTRWAKQGILLLNPSLTVEIGSTDTHSHIWNSFITALFEMLSEKNTGIIFVFMGDKAKEWHKHVGKNNYKFFTSHPGYDKINKWDSGNLFNQINKILNSNNGEQITW